MRCFTDEELRRGIDAAICGWDRCLVCGAENADEHDAQAHPFRVKDPLDLFLEAATNAGETAHGDRGAS